MKHLVSALLVICLLITGTLCFAEETIEVKGTATVNWDSEPVQHEDFTDLGDYIIDLGTITQEDYEAGLAAINSRVDLGSAPACTAVVKRNSKGEVIVGRNMDLEVSNYAAYIAHYVGGKYQALGLGYNNKGDYTYAELQQMDSMPEGYRVLQAAAALDAFNEEGLYIQCNMRSGNGHLSDGTNPGGIRISIGTLAPIVAQNCATVAEAVDFIRNELDVYSIGSTTESAARSGWDLAYLIGDATGEYGIVEFANNQVYFTPYANGHSNTYVHPNLDKYNNYSGGFGRQAIAMDAMIGAETADDMMEAIHKADWYREIQDIKYSYKDEDGVVHFVDKDGNPSIDYRTDLTGMFCVSDDGELIPDSNEWISALNSILTGQSFTYLDWTMENVYVFATEEQTQELKAWEETLQGIALETILHYRKNCTSDWITDDANFEVVKEAVIGYFESLNAFELLENFFAGDEQGLRDSGDIFTTGMNIGVNCGEKYLKVRYMEHESCIYEYQW